MTLSAVSNRARCPLGRSGITVTFPGNSYSPILRAKTVICSKCFASSFIHPWKKAMAVESLRSTACVKIRIRMIYSDYGTLLHVKIVLATPVYPPEIGGPATYIKELAPRLKGEHKITIVAYASTSEQIPGTKLITVSKRRPLPVRLVIYFFKLYRAARGADVLYVQNGVASGLPAVLVGRLCHLPVVIKFVGDEAWERATHLRQTTQMLEDFLEHPHASLKIRLIMRLQGFVLRRANAVTTPSAYLARVIEKIYKVPAKRIVVNYNT